MRKAKNIYEDYNKPFPTKLRELIETIESDKKQETLGSAIGVTRQTVSAYLNGSSAPPYDKFIEIANYFNVSCEYLVGKTDVPSPDTNIQAINKMTGLSEEAIKLLMYLHDKPEIEWINLLLSNEGLMVLFHIEKYKAIFNCKQIYELRKNNYLTKTKSNSCSEQDYIDFITYVAAEPSAAFVNSLMDIEEGTSSTVALPIDAAQEAYSELVKKELMKIIDAYLLSKWNEYNTSLKGGEKSDGDNNSTEE